MLPYITFSADKGKPRWRRSSVRVHLTMTTDLDLAYSQGSRENAGRVELLLQRQQLVIVGPPEAFLIVIFQPVLLVVVGVDPKDLVHLLDQRLHRGVLRLGHSRS